MAMAARMPMIATTIISSMSVKPRCRDRSRRPPQNWLTSISVRPDDTLRDADRRAVAGRRDRERAGRVRAVRVRGPGSGPAGGHRGERLHEGAAAHALDGGGGGEVRQGGRQRPE